MKATTEEINTNSVVEKDNNSVLYSLMPDFQLKDYEEDLNDLAKELSAEEEQILEEILKLEEQGKGGTDLMKDLLEDRKSVV